MTVGTKLSQHKDSLHKFLGHGMGKFSIVNSALLAAISLFYVYSVGNHLPIVVYYFLTRFTYIKPFNDYIVSRYFDSITICVLTLVWLILSPSGKSTKIFISTVFGISFAIAIAANLVSVLSVMELVTIPIVIFILVLDGRKRRSRKKILKSQYLNLALNYAVIVAIVLGIVSIAISLSVVVASQDFSVEDVFTTRKMPVDNNGYEILVLFSTLSPLLLIAIFFGYPLKFLVKTVIQRTLRHNKKHGLRSYEFESSDIPRSRRLRIAFLSLFVLISVLLAIIPQLPTVNEENQQIGSDSDSYVEWVDLLGQAKNLQEFLKLSFIDLTAGDRPLSIIILFFFSAAIDAPLLDAIEYVPVILSPALVLVVYFFTRELTSNETASLFAAFLTGLGYFQLSMGVYAGFFANWIALIIGYTSLIFYFRFLRTSNKIWLSIFFVLLLAMLFSHAYTWTVFTIVISVFLIVSLSLRLYARKNTILLLIVVILTVGVDVIKTALIESLGAAGGVKLTISLAQSSIGLRQLGLVWETLVDATQHHYGGILCNIIVLGLVIYWLVRSDLRKDFNRFIVVFLMIGIPVLFFGDWVIQSRVFYNIPFQIPAAIGLTYISQHKNAPKILVPICIWLVAISIWTVSNFYEVTPS